MGNIAAHASIPGIAPVGANSFKKDIFIDFLMMTGLFLTSFFSVYFIQGIFNYLFFLLPLFFAWKTEKKDYFWLGFFFVLMTQPAFFFWHKEVDAICRTPFYSLGGLGGFTPEDLYLFLVVLKAYLKGKDRKIKINKPIVYLGLYFLLVSIPMTFIFGVESMNLFLNRFRSVTYFFMLYAFVKLVKDEDELIKFGYVIAPYIFLILFNQFWVLNYEDHFINQFDPQKTFVLDNMLVGDESKEMTVRGDMGYQEGTILVLFILMFSLQIKGMAKYEIFKGFSDVLTVAAVLSIFLAASRTFTVMSLVTIFIYSLLSQKQQLGRLIAIFSIGIVLFFTLQYTGLLKEDALKNITARFNIVLEAVEEKDMEKTDTFQGRIALYYPTVFSGISNSPFFGLGLSADYSNTYNVDIGWPNTILLLGIVGAVGFWVYYGKITFFYLYYRKNRNNSEIKRNIASALAAVLIALLLPYLTTYDFFSTYPHKLFFTSILFGTADIINRS